MEIQINNELITVQHGTTIHEVVFAILQLNPAGMAIAVNDTVVPRSQWETSLLQADDKILVIKACSGG
jgi:sulfur carrier protein